MTKSTPYLMVSLEDSESKALAQVLSNDTSRAIMKYLTQNDKATESDISTALSLPLSTVHYNIQNLVASKLVKAIEFHYSEKGKEVLHYTLSNKIIVIAPSNEEGFRLIKRVAPVAVLVAGLGLGLSFIKSKAAEAPQIFARMAADASTEAVPLMQKSASNLTAAVSTAAGAPTAIASTTMLPSTIPPAVIPQIAPFYTAIWFWFVIGAVIAVAAFIGVDAIIKKAKK